VVGHSRSRCQTWYVSRHLSLVSVLAAFLALTVGWALGTWATCGASCRFDVDLFGALAGWIGGLATAAAAWFVAYQFGESLRDADAAALAVARMCALRIRPIALNNGRYAGASVTFTNRTSSPVTDVIVGYKGKLARRSPPSIASLVDPGANPWGFKLMFADHRLPGVSAGEMTSPGQVDAEVRRTLNKLKNDLEFEFGIGRRRYRRVGTHESPR
jgi:hypothetical protein